MSVDLVEMSTAQQVIVFSQRLAPLIAENKKGIEKLRKAQKSVEHAKSELSGYLDEVARLRNEFPDIGEDDISFLEMTTAASRRVETRAPSIDRVEKVRLLKEIWSSKRDSIDTFAALKREFRKVSNGGNLGSISTLCDSGILTRDCFAAVPLGERHLGSPIVKEQMDLALNAKAAEGGKKTKR